MLLITRRPFDHCSLLMRSDAAEHGVSLERFPKTPRVVFEVAGIHGVGGIRDASARRDRGGRARMVAGDDLDCHPLCIEVGDRGSGVGPHAVDEGDDGAGFDGTLQGFIDDGSGAGQQENPPSGRSVRLDLSPDLGRCGFVDARD